MAGPGRYVVELLAAFFLTLTVLGAGAQDLVLGALAIGAMVAVLVRSGGHANPVLTLAVVAARRLHPSELLPCWAAQFVGALLAAALARLLVPAEAVGPLEGTGVVTVLVVEVLFAFLLCLLVLTGDNAEHPPDLVSGVSGGSGGAGTLQTGLAAGLVVVAGAALLDPVAAAAFNPAVAFGQVVAGVADWDTIWVYLVGCPVGAVVAGVVAGRRSATRRVAEPRS